MSSIYDHKKIEPKWQKIWEKKKAFKADGKLEKKFYSLIEFPFPSGDGLHVGHIRSNTAMDVISRKRRAEGYDVLYPIGWDAFGLPTENYAIKTGLHPSVVTKKNTDTFRRQLKALGFSFDWSREIDTTDPKYYRWTQWIFLQFLKKGLAYKKKMTINWCPKDLIGLANEEVVNGCCERCGTPVEKREREQWMLAITKYADRLDKDLDDVNFLERIKIQQRNWIGRSEGAEFEFKIAGESVDSNKKIKVFTTRPETLFGVTYVVLAPDCAVVSELMHSTKNAEEVKKYIQTTKSKTDIERTDAEKEKTGIVLDGVFAINPANEEKIPVWIADYVLGDYGTGAVMAVPAHDERDSVFAKKYDLPTRQVIEKDLNKLINSGEFNGQVSIEVGDVIAKKFGNTKVTYKLRDWIFSRQRYWGEPIPVVHCEKCGIVPVPEKNLPVKLPKVKNYKPTETGESPLASIEKWVNTKCPQCRGKARRETDTMPNWAGSSWYYLRYIDPKNKKAFAGAPALKYWTPVDWYNGGMEHTTLHLLYSRFWHKFLFDQGIVPTSEPYMKRTSHGLILASGGEKMSKSKGNVVNPDSIIETVGADSLRLYEMFMGPFDQPIAWETNNIAGVRRFIEKVWRLHEKVGETKPVEDDSINSLDAHVHRTIKKVTEDIENMRFNTAISAMMILVNEFEKVPTITRSQYQTLIQLLAPFAPHVSEEMWAKLGNKNLIQNSPWPTYDESKLVSSTSTIAIQINGKTRATIDIDSNMNEDSVKSITLENEEVKKWLNGGTPKKVIYVKGRVVNIVI